MSRELALEQELEKLNALNESVDGLLKAFEKVGSDITVAKNATENTSGLLQDWTKILNQSIFVQSALNDSQWNGESDNENDEKTEELQLQREELEAELVSVEAENDRLKKSLQSGQSPEKTPKRARR